MKNIALAARQSAEYVFHQLMCDMVKEDNLLTTNFGYCKVVYDGNKYAVLAPDATQKLHVVYEDVDILGIIGYIIKTWW